MKQKWITLLLLTALLLTGCNIRHAAQQMDRAEDQLEQIGDNLEDAVEGAIYGTTPATGTNTPATTTPVAPQTPATTLTPEQAEDIALTHAGLTREQVSRLHTEYEIDNRIPEYDVSFHQGNLEYEYEIHAETGEILSYERDD
ncbi:MAG: hypothetical protein E7459_08905 [Ruminococcaceae bacterium]|nr:hypothetical protein [Oscillospiraceae bacterium]